MGNHSLLHGILPTQGSNPGLLHCRQILYHFSHQGSLKQYSMEHYCFFKIFIYLFIHLTASSLSCGMWDLVPWPGIEPWPPALGAWNLSHWTTREVPTLLLLKSDTKHIARSLWEKTRVGWFERIALKHVYYHMWNRSKFNAWDKALKASALGQPWVMGCGGRWEGVSGWGTHVHPWVIHVNAWQKSLQYCKVISLQLE